MGKVASKNLNVAVATIAMEPYVTNASLEFTQELGAVAALSDLGPRVVKGNYDYRVSLDGAADFGTGLSDATVYAMVGTTAVKALAFDPTGSTAAGADDPHYDASDICLSTYRISATVGAGVMWSAVMQGNSSMARAVA